MSEPRQRTWGEAIRAFSHPRVVVMLFLGFSAGIPYYLIFGTLSIWLREAGVDRSSVTFFSWAILGYSFKYVWAPLIDRLPIPWLTARLGRRRSWMLFAQGLVIASILAMASVDPRQSLVATALAAVCLGLSAATQDIVIDAYRIEAIDTDYQALMASTYVAGYRMGMLLASAGVLKLASHFGSTGETYVYAAWAKAYGFMGLAMLIGVATTLLVQEPEPQAAKSVGDSETEPEAGSDADAPPPPVELTTSDYARFVGLFAGVAVTFIAVFFSLESWIDSLRSQLIDTRGWGKPPAGLLVETLRMTVSLGLAGLVGYLLILVRAVPPDMMQQTYVAPVTDFVRRYGRAGLIVLLLISTYRISDLVMGTIAHVFYVDIGFTKDQIADIAKTFGLLMTIAGGFFGGLFSVRYGMRNALMLGAASSALTNVLFAYLANVGANTHLLIAVIAADNLAQGIAVTAFVAYLSSLTSVSFTATQYALFSSIMTLFPKFVAGYSGSMVDAVGYPTFFVGTALIGIPVLVLIHYATRLEADP